MHKQQYTSLKSLLTFFKGTAIRDVMSEWAIPETKVAKDRSHCWMSMPINSSSLRNCTSCVLLDIIIHTYSSFVLGWSWIWESIKRTVPLQPDFPDPALLISFSSIPHTIFIKTFRHWKGWNTFTWKENRETVWFLIFLKGCNTKWFVKELYVTKYFIYCMGLLL